MHNEMGLFKILLRGKKLYEYALFPIWGDGFFFGGLTASLAPLQPGATRCDVTPVRDDEFVSSKIFEEQALIA